MDMGSSVCSAPFLSRNRIADLYDRIHTVRMRTTILIFVIFVLALSTTAPAFATSCDTRCDKGEVWTERDGGTCVPEEPQTS
jgi:hypothetical protein